MSSSFNYWIWKRQGSFSWSSLTCTLTEYTLNFNREVWGRKTSHFHTNRIQPNVIKPDQIRSIALKQSLVKLVYKNVHTLVHLSIIIFWCFISHSAPLPNFMKRLYGMCAKANTSKTVNISCTTTEYIMTDLKTWKCQLRRRGNQDNNSTVPLEYNSS